MTWWDAVLANVAAMALWHWRRPLTSTSGLLLQLIGMALVVAGAVLTKWGALNLVACGT